MARINLLPWREQAREERKKRFIAVWVATVVASLMVVFIVGQYMSSSISYQQGRNQYLQSQIDTLDNRIAEIKDLKSKKEELLERMEVIQNLQGNRPVIVRIFDEVANMIPEGVYFKSLKLDGHRLSLVGMAESNDQISALMRNFDASEWFTDPNLTAVRKINLNGERVNEFDLTIRQINPGQNEEEL
ncbi:pilus assembly protein PilN [Endozoicomonas sp. (ex Bugula neritina AB1)]|nr:pilus assembly protein PilN [Endozoicomonas sp. (ex Bugula neritina AB1)]